MQGLEQAAAERAEAPQRQLESSGEADAAHTAAAFLSQALASSPFPPGLHTDSPLQDTGVSQYVYPLQWAFQVQMKRRFRKDIHMRKR